MLYRIVNFILLAHLMIGVASCDQQAAVRESSATPGSTSGEMLGVPEERQGSSRTYVARRFESDPTYSTTPEDKLYAEQVVNNLRFKITKDSISFGPCTEELRRYTYNTNGFHKGAEAVYIGLSSGASTINLMGTYKNDFDSCIPLENKVIYRGGGDTLVVYDRKHYFYFTPGKGARKAGRCSSVGVPGDVDNYWRQQCSYAEGLGGAYREWRLRYPHLLRRMPEQLPGSDDVGDRYRVKYDLSGVVHIYLEDPMGTVYARFTPDGKTTKLLFEMQYPELG